MLDIATRFIDQRVSAVEPCTKQDLAINPYFGKALAMPVNAISSVGGGGVSQSLRASSDVSPEVLPRRYALSRAGSAYRHRRPGASSRPLAGTIVNQRDGGLHHEIQLFPSIPPRFGPTQVSIPLGIVHRVVAERRKMRVLRAVDVPIACNRPLRRRRR